ncbi:MAG: hypothetical protein IPL79_04590 [Myxococcales bacterium]|nr:hypothetical protein [Myxococcales bacterium]
MQLRTTAWAAIFVLLAGPLVATAQPSRKDQKKGEALYDKAKAEKDKGDCAAALPKFAEALALTQNNYVLFDLAQCFERTSEPTKALHHYLLLNARLPTSPLVDAVNDAVATIEAGDERAAYLYYAGYLEAGAALPPEQQAGEYTALAIERKLALETKNPSWAKSDDPDVEKPPLDKPDLGKPDVKVPVTKPRTPARPGRTKKLLGIGLAAAGLGTGAVAGYYGIYRGGQLADDSAACAADADCKDTERADDLNTKGKLYNRRGFIFGAIGGAALAGGVVLYWLGHKQAKAGRTSVTLVPSIDAEGGVSAVLVGTF